MTLAPEAPQATQAPERSRFQVSLHNFTGPFDLLLQLIGRHELDVTEVALSRVTDDFIAYTAALGDDADLEETTGFLVVAATLLDLKAARLLPQAEVEDEEDLALLEARDVLFARLLQYRAYQQVAALFRELEGAARMRYPRAVTLEPRYAELLPPVQLGVDADGFAELAAAVFRPVPPPMVGLDHLHASTVSVPEQVEILSGPPAPAGARRRSPSSSRTASTASRSWDASSRCWRCTAPGTSRSTSPRRSPSCGCAGRRAVTRERHRRSGAELGSRGWSRRTSDRSPRGDRGGPGVGRGAPRGARGRAARRRHPGPDRPARRRPRPADPAGQGRPRGARRRVHRAQPGHGAARRPPRAGVSTAATASPRTSSASSSTGSALA